MRQTSRADAGAAPVPAAVVLPPAPSEPSQALPREEARDTLAPSSFGSLGSRPHPGAPPTGVRSARAPLPTLGELEGASATATLRPPGAVPPPPRALPTATPSPDPVAFERHGVLETPLPLPRTPITPALELDSTLGMSGSASKKAAQAALVEQSRLAESVVAPSAVPAPGLYIADEPLERRPKQASLVTVPRQELTRLRGAMLVLGGLLLMAAGALVVLVFRRADANRQAVVGRASASVAAVAPPGCALHAPPSRISPIERSVPIAARTLADGNVALAFAETKTSAVAFLYRPVSGDVERQQTSSSNAEVTHVSLDAPPIVTRGSADFALGQALSPGLELGVGANGILRRGSDGATGVVWSLPTGSRVTQPRVVQLPGGYFVTFRQGGAEGQIVTGWVRADGTAASELTPLSGLPHNLGTPTTAVFAERALLLVSARADKTERYRIFAAPAAPGQAAGPARVLEAPGEGGGAIAPSLSALPGGRYLLQWTDGNVGQYQVRSRILNAELSPLAPPALVSAKGANAGQGVVVGTARGAASFFIQTTAGHDELWGVALTCH
ncbi:MAG: hypothetical protein EOO73_23920 [Myxococcales bacterium]|nr:MAG: hypothetical protein EOO73_23920 [Myxococcales bacterium]